MCNFLKDVASGCLVLKVMMKKSLAAYGEISLDQ